MCQFKYYVDFCERKAYRFNDYTRKESGFWSIPEGETIVDLVRRAGTGKQNVVYCSFRKNVVDFAVAYADGLEPIDNDKLRVLSQEIANEVHEKCFLAELILKSVAYHVGHLLSNIRLRIEKSFEEGDLRTIFCTSTLVDPACGSGNFLTETFLRLRELENRALGDMLHDQGYLELGGENSLVKVSIDQFYGIEINDFAVAVSKTVLWIAEQQALDDTEAIAGQAMPHLPLHDSGNIVCANALRYDWNELLPGGECDYVMGQPAIYRTAPEEPGPD